NVTSLLKTVKTVEDESCRGTRALEAAIDSVNQELKMYEGVELPEDRKVVTPDDLETLKNPIITGTSHSDVMAAANTSRKAVADLLSGVKLACAMYSQPNQQQQHQSASSDQPHGGRFVEGLDEPSYRLYMTARDLCHCYLNLMQMLLEGLPSTLVKARTQLRMLKEEVDKAVSQVEDVVRRLNDLKLNPGAVRSTASAAKTVGFVKAGKTASRTSGSTTNVRTGGRLGGSGRPPAPQRTEAAPPAQRASSRKQPILDSAMDIADAISKLLQYAQLAQKELALKNAEANADVSAA
uniref:Talin_middle domain-containing protein n=1 Tax=Macrostomum lignano TaxID=282301 RepID=A0A1I8G7J8_9PLAT